VRRATTTERALLISGITVLLAVVLVVLWPSSPHQGSMARSSASTTTSTAPSLDATTTSQVTLVDATRPLVDQGTMVATRRSLPTTIIAPTGPGRHPLVVFIHGYEVGPSFYARYLHVLAAHGYVVAAPSFPLEDPANGHPLTETDLPNEAGDVAFVIRTLTTGPWAAHLARGQIAVVGHSDGADVALLTGYSHANADPQVRAVIADAPDAMTVPTIAGGPPLELLHGSADQIVDPASAATVMTQVAAERWSVTLAGADHASPIQGPSPWSASFDAATLDFLSTVLAGRGTATLTATLGALPGVSVVAAPGP
jgi:pimeloyl-ACP methyl ester carboxylesterase